MTELFTSGWEFVDLDDQDTANDRTDIDVPDGLDILTTEVRWRGVESASSDSERTYSNSEYSSKSNYSGPWEDVDTGFPSAPADETVTGWEVYFEIDLADPDLDFSYDIALLDDYEQSVAAVVGQSLLHSSTREDAENGHISRTFSGSGSPPTNGARLYVEYHGSSGGGHGIGIYIEPRVVTSSQSLMVSESLSTVFNYTTGIDGPDRLEGGETSAWVSAPKIENGLNYYKHSVAGSSQVEFQVRYEYRSRVSGSALPTAGAGSSTYPVLTDIAQSVRPTVGVGSASVVRFVGADGTGGWSAKLISNEGEVRRFGSDELLKVALHPEHTRSWGVNIEIPPRIDIDSFRSGSLRLSYNGVLQVDCPAIVNRDRAVDGKVSIDSVGPSSQLRSKQVDRSVNDVFVHSTIRSLLLNEGELSMSQVNVFEPPEQSVENETVLSAATESEFADVLQSRSRDESGRFVSEEGGDAPNWLSTAPLEFAPDGGVRTQQSCVLLEGEDFEPSLSSGVSDSSGTRSASSGSLLYVSSAGDVAGYRFSFDYEVPEGALSIAILATDFYAEHSVRSEYRVSAGDRELFSFDTTSLPVEDVPTWLHFDTGFQPGQGSSVATSARDSADDETTLFVECISDGGPDLALDLIAVYDNRFEYTWSTDFTGSNEFTRLPGPELYPDAVELTFQPVPVGIGLDEATFAATVDARGESSQIGLTYTSTDSSQSKALIGTSDSITTAFEGVTTRIRPTVVLSRTSVSSDTTPTRGNAPQTLKSLSMAVSGNQIPVLDSRSFDTTVYDAVQKLCTDYGFVWSIDRSRAADRLVMNVFLRGDPALRRPLPDAVSVIESQEAGSAQNYANRVTVFGTEIPGAGGTRYSWTEDDPDEIAAFGVVAVSIDNDAHQSVNDCRSQARTVLADRLDEDERGGKLSSTPALVKPGYPYHVTEWEDSSEGWGSMRWGTGLWGAADQVYATLESSSRIESHGSASTEMTFGIRSDLIELFEGRL